MILSTYGLNGLLLKIRGRGLAWGIFILACCLIPFEYLVRYPMPTTPIESSPALTALANDKTFIAVLNYPVPDNTVNLNTLTQQVQHQHPMIGGRVYRDQPGGGTIQTFLSRVIATPLPKDIAPIPTTEQRLAALNHFAVGRVIYQPEGDPKGEAKIALNNFLGNPIAENIYTVPPSSAPRPPSTFFVFGDNWYAPEAWGDSPGRWFKEVATVYVFSEAEQTSVLKFTAIPGQDLRNIVIKLNGNEAAHFAVGDWATFETLPLNLNNGLNEIQFVDLANSWQFTGDPRCKGGSAVAGPFPLKVECDSSVRETRDLSLVIKDLSLGPVAAAPQILASFGEIDLISARVPSSARESIVLNLLWRASGRVDRDYTLFVHLVDATGKQVAGTDAPPPYATTRWRPNEWVAYNVVVQVPPNTPAGAYSVVLGWYEWPSLERILLKNGADALNVGAIQVTR